MWTRGLEGSGSTLLGVLSCLGKMLFPLEICEGGSLLMERVFRLLSVCEKVFSGSFCLGFD